MLKYKDVFKKSNAIFKEFIVLLQLHRIERNIKKVLKILGIVIGAIIVVVMVVFLIFSTSKASKAKKRYAQLGEEAPALTIDGSTFRDLNKNGSLEPTAWPV